jgi:AcrR family transcriptional regulator
MTQPAKTPKVAKASPGAGRRGRPTPGRIAAIDASIREAAIGVFLEGGLDAASMEAIALSAGVAKGTLYARYANKEALFRAILDEEVERWSQRAGAHDDLLPNELAPRLRHHARNMIDAYAQPEHARINRLVEAAAPSLPNLAHHWQKSASVRFLRFLAGDIAKVSGGAAHGDVEIDWDFHAKLFFFSLAGWLRSEPAWDERGIEEGLRFADGVIATIELAIASAAPSSD